MSNIPAIRQYVFAHIASTLERMNVDVGRTFERQGIPDWRHVGETELIPVVHFMNAFEAGARATGEERFSMLVAEETRLESFLDFGRSISAGLTVYDGMNIACQLISTQAPTLKFWLSRRTGGVLFCRKQLLASPELSPALTHVERYAMLLMLNMIRAGAGPTWSPPRVCLSTKKDELFGQWSEFQDASVVFYAPHSAIFVPNEILVLPIVSRDERASEKSAIAKQVLLKDQTGHEFVHDLRNLTGSLLQQKSATLDVISEVTFLSTRTIQRRLAAKGQTFRSILDQARFQRAVSILEESDTTIADISEQLGYEHPQHFIRAFRRWAGVTPEQYRKIRFRRK